MLDLPAYLYCGWWLLCCQEDYVTTHSLVLGHHFKGDNGTVKPLKWEERELINNSRPASYTQSSDRPLPIARVAKVFGINSTSNTIEIVRGA